MPIYYLVRSKQDGKATQSQFAKGFVVDGTERQAENAAKNAAIKHGKPFTVFKVIEQEHGTFKPVDGLL